MSKLTIPAATTSLCHQDLRQVLAERVCSALQSVDARPSARGLTVVIPAYKPQFLHATLASLARQSDSDFHVVVGDDAGPPELASICVAFASKLRLHYHRFERNLGSSDLAAQWQRSVNLATTPWAMVLGDDDQLDPDGVAAFQRTLQTTEQAGGICDLYRFDTRRVDIAGDTLGENIPHPAFATCNDFIYARFCGLSSYLNEFVFSVDALRSVGGFVSFPLGWSSDDATWVLLAQRTGIRSIDGPKVSWRLSGANISSYSSDTAALKLDLWLNYLDWLDRWDAARLLAERLPAETRIRAVDLFCERWLASLLPVQPLHLLRWARRLSGFSRLPLRRVARQLLWAVRHQHGVRPN